MKDESGLLPTSRFSKLTGVPQSTLRHYEEIGLLSPARRGEADQWYYSPFQVTKIRFIGLLVDLGFSPSEIKIMEETRTPEKTLQLLSAQEGALDRQMRKIQSLYSVIHALRDNIQRGLSAKKNEIDVKDLPEARIALGRPNDWIASEASVHDVLIDPYDSADVYGVDLNYPMGGYYFSMAKFLENPDRPGKFFSFDPGGNDTRKAGKYLVGYCGGCHGKFGNLPRRMLAYAKERRLTPHGPVYTAYLLDSVSVRDPKKYLCMVCVRVLEEQNG